MKYLKLLGVAAIASMGLVASVGVSPASATVLCAVPATPCNLESQYLFGTKFSATAENFVEGGLESIPKITTAFKNIECSKSSISGRTTFSGPAESIPLEIETLTFEECNCEVKVLKKGTLGVGNISGTYNGTVKSNGAEITASCSTIFGTVHCIYATENTDLGTLTGGNPATMDIQGANIPRLSTSALCAETAKWDASYIFTAPKPLYVGTI